VRFWLICACSPATEFVRLVIDSEPKLDPAR
jgi:hypothetical protein